MIRVHHANRLENLIAPLAESVGASQRREPLRTISIIVPNRVAEHFVRYRLAEKLGVAANLKFPFLRTGLAQIAHVADPAIKIIDADALQIVLFECIRGSRHASDPELAPVRDYVGSGAETDRESRTLQLAGRIARLFREYSISRRAILKQWSSSTGPAAETERWQRHLWRSVFDANGCVRPQWVSDPNTRWMMLPDAFQSIDREKLQSAVGGTLHVFGLSYMGTAFAEIFGRIASVADLQIYALNPCLEFWEDVDTSRKIGRKGWARRTDKPPTLDDSEDPFDLDNADTPALRLWGRPGRENIRLLGALTDCDFNPHFSIGTETHPRTVLGALQEDILNRAPERPPIGDANAVGGDASIRFLKCPGIRREVEIVANEIWSLILDNEAIAAKGEADRLRFHEIAVLVPDDSLNDYLPHIESVFRRQHRIPVNLASRQFAGESRVAEVIGLLAQLPLGRLTRGELLRLLTHPAIAGAEAEGDTDAWRIWLERIGVYFGAGGEDQQPTYIPNDLFNWDQALKRLALGAFMSGEPSGAVSPFSAPGGHTYLPFEAPQDAIAGLARMIRLARSMIADALEMKDARMSPAQWSQSLNKLVAKYVHTIDPADERIRDRILDEIEKMAFGEFACGPIAYPAVHDLLTERIGESESRQGNFPQSGVAAGAFSTLRSIPFKVIFALGIGEGRFPARTPADPLDLRWLKRTAGDVTPTERDRYLFLETILAARQKLYLSWIARDATTGDALEASSVVSELRHILRGYAGMKTIRAMTIEHRASRYDLSYFPDLPGSTVEERERGLVSYNTQARQGARMAALKRSLTSAAESAALPAGPKLLELIPEKICATIRHNLRIPDSPASTSVDEEREEISLPLSALRRFLECPLQGAARFALGMFNDDDDDEVEDEPLAMTHLNRAILMRDVLRATGGIDNLIDREYSSVFKIAQMKGNAPAGPFAEAEKTSGERCIRDWIANARDAGIADLDRWVSIQIGGGNEFARADRTIEPIALDVPIKKSDGSCRIVRLSLHGTTDRISPGLNAALQGVARKEAKVRDFIQPFISAIALAAAGERVSKTFRAIVVGIGENMESERVLRNWDRDDARKYLTTLAGDLLSGEHDYFLPIEAAEKAFHAIKHGEDPVKAVLDVRDMKNVSCSSDYGPLRPIVTRGFDPPDRRQIESIIARRFGPIASIFENRKRVRES